MTKKITFRVTDQEYTELAQQAEENKLSIAGLCRVRAVSGDAHVLEDRRKARAAIHIRRLISPCSIDSETKTKICKELDKLCRT